MSSTHTSQTTISFGTTEATSSNASVRIETDPDHKDETPNRYMLVFVPSASSGKYEMKSSAGSMVRKGTNIPVKKTETLTFANAASASISYPIKSVKRWQWLGVWNGNPMINQETGEVTVKSPVIGVLKVTYMTQADRWYLNGGFNDDIDTIVVCGVLSTGESAGLTITKAEEEGEEKEWVLTVKDFCTDEVLSGVSVIAGGKLMGTTDSNGKISLGIRPPGKTIPLELSKPGYLNSKNDFLKNDAFTT